MNAPRHIAIIMDGNGRWAQKRRLPKTQGHQEGVKTVREIVKRAGEIGVETLTLFAFSSENKNRPQTEVGTLFKLFVQALKQETKKLAKNNVRLKIIGDLSLFPEAVRKNSKAAEAALEQNNGLKLIIAANYGGRWDIVRAAKRLAEKVKAGVIIPENIDAAVFGAYLALADEPPVDLLIRTSGELRVSNFLLWDIAYSEFYFTPTLWPDFTVAEFDRAIENFHARTRRFGGRETS